MVEIVTDADGPDRIAYRAVSRDGSATLARCMVRRWTGSVPGDRQPERCYCIGAYTAERGDAGIEMLDRVAEYLAADGPVMLIGPMDGSTWANYRFITERGEQPPFFLEPNHPPRYPSDWLEAGFSPCAEYFSARCDDLTVRDPRLRQVCERLDAQQVTFRPLRGEAFEDELRAIHALSLEAFAGNAFYTPIDRATFLEMYRRLEPVIDPRLVRLAEVNGGLVGFGFALPDRLEPERGEPVESVILKTLAVRPGRQWAGLGAVLLEQLHEAAHALGYRRAVHALMHGSNVSLRMSGHYATPFRRYALFSREVGR